ncbi:site-specific integrase [Kandleria sp.]|uniref:site-specific integrase n=1 Tax=Kandleria sp. TaxID=2774291 RepID=UPI001B6B0E74|nr:site-specific integrase [Kandleria sp.]MBP3275670.1 tyrosine-type recombinase/integrase [Kandleria sp.]
MPVYSYQTKKGKRYRVAFSYVDGFGSARQYHKRGFTSAEEAKRHEAKARLINSTSASEITLVTAIDTFLDYKATRVQDRTVEDYKNSLCNHVYGFYGNIRIRRISVKDIERFQAHLIASSLQEKTISRIQMEFKSFLRYCLRRGYISTNPFDCVELVHKERPKKEMMYYTKEEYRQFRKLISDEDMLLVFDLLYFTGMRIGELAARTWKDINNNMLYIHSRYNYRDHTILEGTKNGSVRHVPLNNLLLKELKEHHEKYPESKYIIELFNPRTKEMGPMDPKRIRRYNDAVCKKHNFKRIRIHDFRHSFISLLINNGMDAFEISNFSGNSPRVIEETYAHMFPNKNKKLLNILDDF